MLAKLVNTGIVYICDEIRLALEATLAFKNFGFQLSAVPVELCVHSYTCSASLRLLRLGNIPDSPVSQRDQQLSQPGSSDLMLSN